MLRDLAKSDFQVLGKVGLQLVDRRAKVVDLDFGLTSRGSILEMTFETGSVSFQTGGRVIKSPFFNNRYQILAIGVDAAAWSSAGLSFVKIK